MQTQKRKGQEAGVGLERTTLRWRSHVSGGDGPLSAAYCQGEKKRERGKEMGKGKKKKGKPWERFDKKRREKKRFETIL